MGKLSEHKEWLTVAEAARQLTTGFGEKVTEADVLHLVLNRQLPLSVYFGNPVKARGDWIVTTPEFHPLTDGEPPRGVKQRPGELIILSGDDESPIAGEFAPICDESRGTGPGVIILDYEVVALTGVFDLPMIGDERLAIKTAHQNLIGGAAVTHQYVDGVFVQAPDGRLYHLQERYDEAKYKARADAKLGMLTEHIVDKNIGQEAADDLLEHHQRMREAYLKKGKSVPSLGNYFPADGLPQGSVLVVRTKALAEFERHAREIDLATDLDASRNQPPATIERNAAPPVSQSQNGAEDAPRWIAEAREHAKAYIARHKEQDLFPTQADVCNHVEAKLRENKIYGPHGKPLSANYIARNAIQGEWWAKNKP